MSKKEQYIKVQDAARRLGVSSTAVNSAIRKGGIPVLQIGRCRVVLWNELVSATRSGNGQHVPLKPPVAIIAKERRSSMDTQREKLSAEGLVCTVDAAELVGIEYGAF